MKTYLLLASSVMLAMASANANAAIDVVEAPTGFFVPTDAEKYDLPYYRSASEDWGWTHGAIAAGFTSAMLSISAFDVDTDGNGGTFPPEIDNVYVMDSGVWTLVGNLQGFGDVWEFSNFALGANFFDDIAAGLQVRVDIDVENIGWAVALAKSTLTTDGSDPGDPNPGVPEPASWAMMIGGLGLVGGAMRRRSSRRVSVAYSA